MALDVKKLRPTDLCQLLNSTPLGEVIDTHKLRRHRERGGLRFGGGGRHVDLYRYIAWLFQARHLPKQQSANTASTALDLAETAQGAAEVACQQHFKGHGQKFARKHKDLIAALITEPTQAKAAAKAGVGKATLNRWLQLPEFQAAYRQACQALYEAAGARMRAASGLLVDSALNVALNGRRDSDRIRASFGLLDRAHRSQANAAPLHGTVHDGDALLQGTARLLNRLEAQLEQVDRSDLPIAEKARLTTMLSDAILRARKEDDLVQRLEALEALSQNRKENTP